MAKSLNFPFLLYHLLTQKSVSERYPAPDVLTGLRSLLYLLSTLIITFLPFLQVDPQTLPASITVLFFTNYSICIFTHSFPEHNLLYFIWRTLRIKPYFCSST